MKLRKMLLCVLALALVVLAGCQETPAVQTTTVPPTTDPPVEQLTVTVTEDTIGLLEQYPALKTLDLTGSTCYEAIAEYMRKHPAVDVTYTVKLGGVSVSNKETDLVLDPGLCDYDTLAQNLAYLPGLKTVDLPRTTYSAQEIVALQGLYPDVTWNFTVILLGQELTSETTQLNLSVMEQERVAEVAGKLSLFPNIETVELMDGAGRSQLSMADVKTLQEAAPNTVFHYIFELFGKTVATTDERIEFVKQDIGNEGEAELRSALDILQGCTYLLLDDCGFDNEVLAKVRDDYPRTEVVWRIHVWKRSWLTDTDTIRAVYHVDDTNCEPFKYCTKTKYIDMGHNEELTDIRFISYMPDLEIVILSGSPISDLSPFADHTKLVFLELAYCGNIKDISALKGCTSLANVNLSFTKVSDISALYELPLEQLCAVKSKIQWASWEKILEVRPDCVIRYDGTQPYGTGWRYKRSGAYTDIYKRVREVFDLDEVDKLIAAGAK